MPSPPPTPKVRSLGILFRKQADALRRYASSNAEALRLQQGASWYAPEKEEWNGDPFLLEELHKPFDRSQHEAEFDAAVSDPQSPGVTGDLAISQLQGDFLAALERAYRSRLRTSVRNKIHAFARLQGHGADYGVINVGMVNYVERLIARANQR